MERALLAQQLSWTIAILRDLEHFPSALNSEGFPTAVA